MQVHYDAAHKWYYLADQEPSELLVFRQTDSHPTARVGMCAEFLSDVAGPWGCLCSFDQGVPHSSFPNPLAGADELPRESIEVRTLVSYGHDD